MRARGMVFVAVVTLLGCDNSGGAAGAASASAAAPAASVAKADPAQHGNYVPVSDKKDSEKTVVDVAIGSPNHTTLVAALKQADLVDSLASPGGVYTVFAPTNAAFDKLPPGTVDGLMKPEKKADLAAILQHHAMVPIVNTKDMKDGQQLVMADGKKITIHVKDGKYMADDANIVASIPCANGVVHVVDAVIVPK